MYSAFINTPPANDLDEKIAAGMLLLVGITPDIQDPKQGVKIPPFRPDDYTFETKGPRIIAALSVCIVIVTVVTLARLGLRLFVPRLQFGADDWVIIPAFMLSVAYPSLQIAMITRGGAGKHMFDITYQEYYRYKWLANISQTFFYVAVGLIKMSIACFNIRLTSIASKFWKYVNYTFLIVCGAYTVAALFLNVFRCDPPGASFDLLLVQRYGKKPKCLPLNTMNTILRLNLALDFVALAIPIIVLWKVQLSVKKKARLFALLSIGLVACVASVMTLVSQFTLAKDPLWNYTTLLAWIMTELVVSMVAASAPTLAYLLPTSMRSQAPNSMNPSKATKGTGYGHGSRIGKQESLVRSRAMGDEEDERHIIKKEEIEMKWTPSAHSDGQSMTSWLDTKDGGVQHGQAVYDASEGRTWAVSGGGQRR